MSFYDEIKKYRVDILKLSQEEAIKRLHMSQAALSLYETGKRQITVETMHQFQRAYDIPEGYLMKMLFGDDAGEDYSPMVLREHSWDSDLQRVIDMLKKRPPLFEALVSLSYASGKTQKDVAELLPHLLKFAR